MLKRFLTALMMALFFVLTASAESQNFLRLHWIKAPTEINWSSPRALLLSSIRNELIGGYAIGHVAVVVECERVNSRGVRHLLTGMTNVSGSETRDAILKKGLAMAVVYHNFEGTLERSKSLIEDLTEIASKGRVETLVVPTTEDRCERMMEFMDRWITHASYRVYGGNKDVIHGEGSGCADFARVLFEVATGAKMPEEWIVRRKIPRRFIGTKEDPVSVLEFLMQKNEWAQPGEPFVEYVTPDPSWVYQWIKKRKKDAFGEYVWPHPIDERSPKPLAPFKYRYRNTQTSAEIWNRIKLK